MTEPKLKRVEPKYNVGDGVIVNTFFGYMKGFVIRRRYSNKEGCWMYKIDNPWCRYTYDESRMEPNLFAGMTVDDLLEKYGGTEDK